MKNPKEKKRELSQADAEFILKHKPNPNLMTISELSERFQVTQSVIYGIWQRDGLPTDKLRPRKKEGKITRNDEEEMRHLFENTKMTDLEIADKMLIVKRLVTKFRKKVAREERVKF